MGALATRLQGGGVILADGAWGTSLRRRGLPGDTPPELWNLDHPEAVARLAADFAACGVTLLGANTFGANPLRLAQHGLHAHTAAINRAGLQISAHAAAPTGALVLPAMGPSGIHLAAQPERLHEAARGFVEQAAAFAAAGACGVAIETMYDLREAAAAIHAATAHHLEALCLFTFDRAPDGRLVTRCGATPERAIEAALAAGAIAAGVNCCDGPATVLHAIQRLHAAHPGLCLVARPSAGLPQPGASGWAWPETPESMGEWAGRLRDAGARVLGGCCGCAPEHIAAMARRLSQ
jgi:5-methyltetrahydrofolate--homocysteine methyltransferase